MDLLPQDFQRSCALISSLNYRADQKATEFDKLISQVLDKQSYSFQNTTRDELSNSNTVLYRNVFRNIINTSREIRFLQSNSYAEATRMKKTIEAMQKHVQSEIRRISAFLTGDATKELVSRIEAALSRESLGEQTEFANENYIKHNSKSNDIYANAIHDEYQENKVLSHLETEIDSDEERLELIRNQLGSMFFSEDEDEDSEDENELDEIHQPPKAGFDPTKSNPENIEMNDKSSHGIPTGKSSEINSLSSEIQPEKSINEHHFKLINIKQPKPRRQTRNSNSRGDAHDNLQRSRISLRSRSRSKPQPQSQTQSRSPSPAKSPTDEQESQEPSEAEIKILQSEENKDFLARQLKFIERMVSFGIKENPDEILPRLMTIGNLSPEEALEMLEGVTRLEDLYFLGLVGPTGPIVTTAPLVQKPQQKQYSDPSENPSNQNEEGLAANTNLPSDDENNEITELTDTLHDKGSQFNNDDDNNDSDPDYNEKRPPQKHKKTSSHPVSDSTITNKNKERPSSSRIDKKSLQVEKAGIKTPTSNTAPTDHDGSINHFGRVTRSKTKEMDTDDNEEPIEVPTVGDDENEDEYNTGGDKNQQEEYLNKVNSIHEKDSEEEEDELDNVVISAPYEREKEVPEESHPTTNEAETTNLRRIVSRKPALRKAVSSESNIIQGPISTRLGHRKLRPSVGSDDLKEKTESTSLSDSEKIDQSLILGMFICSTTKKNMIY